MKAGNAVLNRLGFTYASDHTGTKRIQKIDLLPADIVGNGPLPSEVEEGSSGIGLQAGPDDDGITDAVKEAIKDAAIDKAIDSLSPPRWIIHEGQQGKHIPGHPNFQLDQGRSELTHPNPQDLLDRGAGTGVMDGSGQREWVDFGEPIGIHIDKEGTPTPTTRGRIHYQTSKGKAHIVPAPPQPPEP